MARIDHKKLNRQMAEAFAARVMSYSSENMYDYPVGLAHGVVSWRDSKAEVRRQRDADMLHEFNVRRVASRQPHYSSPEILMMTPAQRRRLGLR
jgi:hypothetical protein